MPEVLTKGGLPHYSNFAQLKAFHGELLPQDPSDEPASVLQKRIRATRAAATTHKGDQPRTAVRRTRPFAGPGAR